MALSGLTDKFKLKYPEVEDDFQVNTNVNDFENIIQSIEDALEDLDLPTFVFNSYDGGPSKDELPTNVGIYKGYTYTFDGGAECDIFIVATELFGTPAYFRFQHYSGEAKILIKKKNDAEWEEVASVDQLGDLSDLLTTSKTDLVSAINEVFNKVPSEGNTIKDLGTLSANPNTDLNQLEDITEPGMYKYFYTGTQRGCEEFMIVSTTSGDPAYISQFRFKTKTDSSDNNDTEKILYRTFYEAQAAGTTIPWKTVATLDDIPEIEGDTIPTINITDSGTFDINNIKIYGNDGTVLDIDSIGSVTTNNLAPIVKILFNSQTDPFDREVYTILQMGRFTSVSSEQGTFYQFMCNGRYLKWRSVGSNINQSILDYNDWEDVIKEKAKPVSVTIGPSGSNADVIYASNLTTALTFAFNELGTNGGEIKILAGSYNMTSACTITGTSTKKVKISGEGLATKITSSAPASYYLALQHCELCNLRLDADVRITTNGYVSIHDCEIANRIYIANSSTIYDIFIYNNNIDVAGTSQDFIYLTSPGGISNMQVHDNYCHSSYVFDFFYPAATKSYFACSFRNNHCPRGTFGNVTSTTSGYSMTGNSTSYYRNAIVGNTFYAMEFKGSYCTIADNIITTNMIIYDIDTSASSNPNYLDIMNNRIDGYLAVNATVTYTNIVNNMIDSASTSPYINLNGGNNVFVGNVIRSTSFGSGTTHTYLPGYSVTSNKWGNNCWSDGFDRIYFANGEGMGAGQGDA